MQTQAGSAAGSWLLWLLVTAHVWARKQLHRNRAVTLARALVTPNFRPSWLFALLSCALAFILSLLELFVGFYQFMAESICVKLLRTQTPSLSLLWAPAILPLQFHTEKDPGTNVDPWSLTPCPHPSRELLTHRNSTATALKGFQEAALETRPACTDISTGHLPLPGKPAQKTGHTHLLGWNSEEQTEYLMGLSL